MTPEDKLRATVKFGQHKTRCPWCHETHSKQNKLATDLSTNRDADRIVFKCHRCPAEGIIPLRDNVVKFEPRTNEPPRSTRDVSSLAPLTKEHLAFLEGRGISAETAAHFSLYAATWSVGVSIGFPYIVGGVVDACKVRLISDKRFNCWQSPRSFFGVQHLKPDADLVVCEGEFDVLALFEAGITAVSAPNGAPAKVKDGKIDPSEDTKYAFLWNSKEIIEAAPRVVIATDMDAPGDALAEEIARRVGKAKCWRVKWREKDANDVLVKHGIGAVLEDFAAAEPWPVEGLYSTREFADDVRSLYDTGVGRGAPTGWGNIDELYSVAEGELTVVTGIPSCLAAGTLVTMADGRRVPIESVSAGDKIMSVNRGFGVVDTVKDAWASGTKEVFLLRTRRGRVVLSTADHQFMTWSGWKPLSNIAVGDSLSTPCIQPMSIGGDEDDLFLAALWLAEGSKNNSSYVFTSAGEELVGLAKAVAARRGWVVTATGKYGWIVSGKPPPQISRDLYVAKRSSHYRVRDGVEGELATQMAEADYAVRAASSAKETATSWLRRTGLKGMTTDTIRIPDWVFSASAKAQSVFVGVLFSCDGSASGNTFEYCSNSEAFCLDLQDLLSRFGVLSYVRFKPNDFGGTWRVTISDRPGREAFVRQFYVPGKQSRFEALAEKGDDRRGDTVPPDVYDELAFKHKWHKKNTGVTIKFGSTYRASRSQIAKAAISENNETVIEKVNTEHRWDEVVEIVSVGHKDVFDIETESNHNFIANGFLVHNCGKSEWVDNLMVNLATNLNWRCAVASFENPPKLHIAKLISKKVGARFFKTFEGRRVSPTEMEAGISWVDDHFVFLHSNSGELSTIDSIIERLKAAVLRYGIRAAVIDPFNYIAREGDNETQWISDLLTKIKVFASAYGVHVWFIAHPQKLQRGADGKYTPPRGYEISGSSHWFNKTDNGITIHRDLDEAPFVRVIIWKCRFQWNGKQGDTRLIYDRDTTCYVEPAQQPEGDLL